MVGFAFRADDVSGTFGTLCGHAESLCSARMIFVVQHASDFGDHIATTFHFYPVANFYAQAFDEIHIVQSGATHRGAADGDRLQHGRRCKLSSSAYRDHHVFDLRDAAAGSEFIRNRPARSFAREAEFVLQRNAIDFDNDAVDFVRKTVAALFPVLNKL